MSSAKKHSAIVKFKNVIHPDILCSLKKDERVEVISEDEILIKEVVWFSISLVSGVYDL